MPSLMASIGLNTTQFDKELNRIINQSGQKSRQLSTKLSAGPQSQDQIRASIDAEKAKNRAIAAERTKLEKESHDTAMADIAKGSVPENFMKLPPDAMARGKANLRIASTMFVSAVRDTFASLASGANPLTVFMQQAPQVLQGLTMIGGRIMQIGLAAGVAAAAAVGLAAVINKWVNLYFKLDALEARGKILDRNRAFWREQRRLAAEATEAAEKEMAKQLDNLKTYADAEGRLLDTLTANRAKNSKTEAERHKILRESAEAELRRAQIDLERNADKKFSKDREQSAKYVELETEVAKKQQAIIDEDSRHRQALETERRGRGNLTSIGVTDRERIGLGGAPSSIAVATLDQARASRQHLAAIEKHLYAIKNDSDGSF